ncbi:MAG: RecX family transcriptional regulator [bacterium]|nr:RecX family transcriptional regulator [bacterium]
MKIIKYKRQRNGKYKVFFDNNKELLLYEDVIINNKLLYVKEINDYVFDLLQRENDRYLAYDEAIKYTIKKIRCKKEVINYLQKKKISDEEIKKIINKLYSSKLLSDEEYVKAYINDRVLLSNDGMNLIKNKLLDNDIDIELVDKYLSLIDNVVWKNKIKKIINKMVISNKNISGSVLKNKIYYKLVNLGYDKEIIKQVFTSYTFVNHGNLKRLYDKLYTKYKQRYTGDELKYKVVNKLLEKGFTREEISKITMCLVAFLSSLC